jgi:3-phosphoglycerate kinase
MEHLPKAFGAVYRDQPYCAFSVAHRHASETKSAAMHLVCGMLMRREIDEVEAGR